MVNNKNLEFICSNSFIIGDNPTITEKTIRNFKEKLQNKPDAFGKKKKIYQKFIHISKKDPYIINEKNEMNIELPTRIITVPRNMIFIKEYEEEV